DLNDWDGRIDRALEMGPRNRLKPWVAVVGNRQLSLVAIYCGGFREIVCYCGLSCRGRAPRRRGGAGFWIALRNLGEIRWQILTINIPPLTVQRFGGEPPARD